MNAILFDTLKFAHRLKDAGFDAKQAEGAAEALGDALTGTVATKADIDALGTRIDGLSAMMKAEISALSARMEGRFAQVDAKIAEVSARIDSKFSETVRWIFAAVVVNVGAIVGLLKLLK
jgi:hypothetical protein